MKHLKLILAGLLAALCVATPVHAEWATAVAASPASGTVLLEAVATSDQSYVQYCAFTAASVAGIFRVQHRNAANDTTIKEQYLPVPANGTAQLCVDYSYNFSLLSGERLRVITAGVIIGTVSVSLQDNIY